MLSILINDIDLFQEYKLSTPERPNIPTPQMRYKVIEVEGMDGSYTQEIGYSDISFSINFNVIKRGTNIKALLRTLKGLFMNANKLVFTDELDMFYKVKRITIGDIQNEYITYGYFTVNFECDPFTYESNVQDISNLTGNLTITNNATYKSLPIITVEYTANSTITWNGNIIELMTSPTNEITINSTIKDAYFTNINMNNYMKGSFPILEVGDNIISFSSSISGITISPNWRWL